MEAVSFDERLHAFFRRGRGVSLLSLLSVAECAGLSARAIDWIRERTRRSPHGTIHFNWFGKRPLDEVVSFWRTLREGSPSDIIAAVRGLMPDALASTADLAYGSLSVPLIFLGRGDVLVGLHETLMDEGFGLVDESAPLRLAEAGDWEHALALLASAHRDGRRPRFSISTEMLLWKFAYLQGHVATVLPALRDIPFNREYAHMADARAWRLVTYQLLAGQGDVVVPVIETDDKPAGYVEAAATQIAVLEDVPSAADLRNDLQRVLTPRSVTVQHADQGWAITLSSLPGEFIKAKARVAASRRNYAKAAEVARSPSGDRLVVPADEVINAFIEEGDWRAAAKIAEQHDPRERPVIEPFDDTRNREYRYLQEIFAAAAARSGDDAAAASFLANCIANYVPDPDGGRDQARDGPEAYGWFALLLAGAAEGRIPRHLLAVLRPVFYRAH